ncbi:MAG: uroporphyrinogen decarboxylase [Chlorobium sp.]|jgi:uroporphyrinogen decarboxylase|uniref:uroporphyrinogen decarboxylase n=1 Tax=Chlorobium sp. TaxID=1095 RepID=UPI001D96D399|nr:uroporphyrinogen decarboxylase [Chlorobium sp.]MBN1279287.1 uroporphyrinogen decarboxylase [Chlorobiaceae bacterium]MCF8217093.1 uroporphyrinogen decarboxylase [Chlorobium sp.]MCF8271939.1 uroporphyrinogen decarboxylase [Chlorobium sp.]MCF8288310.1 uroporphyrinogen decarboxylase [Chlorobium sp.]MCF8291902.1 uroporphyrinogen decarboxylase [Chlorobium sp.]
MLKNDLFLRALKRQPCSRTPIWVMRQAGRYLPEYRAVREKTDFLTLCKTPELAAEVTIQPVDLMGVDAAIIFSDILVINEAMGMNVEIIETKGIKLSPVIRSQADIDKLIVPDIDEKLGYVMDALRLTKKELDNRVPLIGFSGAAWTLFTYAVEGGGSKNYAFAKKMMYREPQMAHQLLRKITETISAYLLKQVEAGADAIQIFDSWASALSEDDYREFALPYIRENVQAVKAKYPDIPVIVFSKDCNTILSDIADTGCDAMGLGWGIDIAKARKELNDRVALQGNLDPTVLYGTPEKIKSEAAKILKQFGQHTATSGHVFNLGHGILPDVDPANLKLLVEFVKEESARYH